MIYLMYMVSQDKLISNGIRYTDSLFEEISKRIEQGVRSSDTLESFLAKYNKAFPEKGNPLITLGYDKKMLDIILQETNNHKFSRPSQKEMVRVTIENKVGEKIVDVGDNITEDVRDIVKDGYDNNLSQDEIAENISAKVSSIKNKRARAIARTEVARAATISDYIINAEMGATHFYVECRNTACPVCKQAWHSKWTEANDESFTPNEYTAGKKGWVGDKVYSIGDTKQLPPIHPNCRCVPYFITENEKPKDAVMVEEPIQVAKTDEPYSSNRTDTIMNVSETIGNYKQLPLSIHSYLDDFARKTKNANKEYSQYYTESGKASEFQGGQSKQVQDSYLTGQWLEEQSRLGEKIHKTHNHPAGISLLEDSWSYDKTLLSQGDMNNFLKEYNRGGTSLESLSAEIASNRATIGKLDTFDEFSEKEQNKALNNAIKVLDEFQGRHKGTVYENLSDKEAVVLVVTKMNAELEKGGMYYRVEFRDLSLKTTDVEITPFEVTNYDKYRTQPKSTSNDNSIILKKQILDIKKQIENESNPKKKKLLRKFMMQKMKELKQL